MQNYTLTPEDKAYIKRFVRMYKPCVLEVVCDENGAEVLIGDKGGNYRTRFWVDVNKDVEMFWNKYIFDLTRPIDVIEDEILYNSLAYLPDGSEWSFAVDAFEVVRYHLESKGIVRYMDDDTYEWSKLIA